MGGDSNFDSEWREQVESKVSTCTCSSIQCEDEHGGELCKGRYGSACKQYDWGKYEDSYVWLTICCMYIHVHVNLPPTYLSMWSKA